VGSRSTGSAACTCSPSATGPAPDKAQLGGGFYAKGWDIARGVSMKQKKACP
jgi:hypothetical protein